MMHRLSDDCVAALRAALLRFFDDRARPLPWRTTRDAYAIWISEVMAQQTRVETVVPYYERWLRSFPDVHTLAAAPVDDVLKAWEGLGYYARARNLHVAARIVRERHGGALPGAFDELRALPGVGDYTAGAVASIAFGERRAAVDGNARRVLARLLDEPDPTAVLVRDTALALVPPDRPGDFNQALMELGATVCTPRVPKCARCPVRDLCRSNAAGTQADRPRPRSRKPVPTFAVATAVLRDPAGRLLLTRRPAHGLLAGMWCFPGAVVESDADAAARALEIAGAHAAPRAAPVAIGVITHVFSHRRERYHCFLVDVAEVASYSGDAVWVHDGDRTLALPRAQQRIRRLAAAGQV